MKKIKILLFMLSCVLIYSLFINYSNAEVYTTFEEKVYCDATVEDEFADNRVMIVLTESASLSDKIYTADDFSSYGCIELEDLTNYSNSQNQNSSYKRQFCLTLDVHSKQNVLSVIENLICHPDILYAGPDYALTAASLMPNDIYVNDQWAIDSISLPEAWEYSTGTSDVVVGVMDTGINIYHPDLRDNVDVFKSRDFTNSNGFVDGHGHGTHVAGIIGAKGNNGIGVTGVNWNVKLAALKVLDNSNFGFTSSVTSAINFAAQNGISILNLSANWLGSEFDIDYALLNAIDNYYGLVVCSAGNYGIEITDQNQVFPPSFDLDNLISVGALNSDDELASFSDYGDVVDIYAPGVDILSTLPDNYGSWDGTSMSAPFVTGVAALLLSMDASLSGVDIKEIIENSADIITITVDGSTQSVKKLNAKKAMNYLMGYNSSSHILSNVEMSTNKTIYSSVDFFERNAILKLTNDDSAKYEFFIEANSTVNIVLYDENWNEIQLSSLVKNGDTTYFESDLSPKIYYLRIYLDVDSAFEPINVNISIIKHVHNFDDWIYYDRMHHINVCECGAMGSIKEVHVVSQSEIVNYKASCLVCGRLLDLRYDIAISTLGNQVRRSVNGSYILPNGIVVLVDSDIESYFNGTLVFYSQSELEVK